MHRIEHEACSIVKGRETFFVWKSGVLQIGVRQTPSKAQGKGVGLADYETFGLENEDGSLKTTKLLLYGSLIRSVLTYASETWPLVLRDEEALGIFERKIFRCILGGFQVNGSWRRRSNLELYKIYKQPKIVKICQITET
ncbi:putative endonuclease-reverse transcriptase [Trichonephila clavipes]|nr:putative endonuclease-reverse transcriptase [Trichonephila clavipes]